MIRTFVPLSHSAIYARTTGSGYLASGSGYGYGFNGGGYGSGPVSGIRYMSFLLRGLE